MMTTKLRYGCALKPGIRTQYKVQRHKRGKHISLDAIQIAAVSVEEMLRMYQQTGVVLYHGKGSALDKVVRKQWAWTQLTGHPRQAHRFKQYQKRTARRLERRKKYRKMTRQEHIMVAEINKAFANYRPTDAGSTKLQEYVEGALAPGTPEQVTGIAGAQET